MSSKDDNSESRRDRHSSDEQATAVTTKDAFHEAVQKLVVEATANDVDVRGGWPVAGGDEDTAWDVTITHIAGRTKAQTSDPAQIIPALIEAVADRENVDLTALPPLYDVVQPSVLEHLSQSRSDEVTVTFQYWGYQVTVRSDGTIFIDE
jgi:hypothetical protein